jgi:hypothetical protein
MRLTNVKGLLFYICKAELALGINREDHKMQYAWELFITYGIGPVFMAALNHPGSVAVACVAVCAAAIFIVEP